MKPKKINLLQEKMTENETVIFQDGEDLREIILDQLSIDGCVDEKPIVDVGFTSLDSVDCFGDPLTGSLTNPKVMEKAGKLIIKKRKNRPVTEMEAKVSVSTDTSELDDTEKQIDRLIDKTEKLQNSLEGLSA